jgi:hypothetical protein
VCESNWRQSLHPIPEFSAMSKTPFQSEKSILFRVQKGLFHDERKFEWTKLGTPMPLGDKPEIGW